MAYTILQLVQQVTGEIGIQQPTSVIGNTDPQVIQLLALTNRLGKDLVADYEWNRLVKAYVFRTTAGTTTNAVFYPNSAVVTGLSTTGLSAGMVVSSSAVYPFTEIYSVDSVSQITLNLPSQATATATASCAFAVQDYALPGGFDRMISDSNWDRTNHWRNLGPKSSQEWQWLQGGIISTGPRERYRLYNGMLRIFQGLSTQINIAYEYVSDYWVVAAGGTSGSKSAFTLDTDTFVYKDDLMAVGLKFMWYRAKGLDYQMFERDYKDELSKAKAQDQPVAAASLSPVFAQDLVGPWSIQDGNWPTSPV